jgi:hypothetical protein
MSAQLRAFSVGYTALRFAVAVFATGAFVKDAAADSWRVTYNVSLIGLPIGTAGVVGQISATNYRIEANAKISGLASVFSNAKGAATGSGGIASGHILPATFATIATNSKMTRTVRMALSGGNVVGVEIAPPIEEKPGRVPVSDQDKRGVIDPVGASIIPMPGTGPLVDASACNRTIPIFDGYTRFDLRLAYVGEREVSTKGYKGPVVVCSARYVPIAGHDPQRAVTKFMAENRQMEVWLAPIESARILVPFRASVHTMIGTTVVEASEFSLDKTK